MRRYCYLLLIFCGLSTPAEAQRQAQEGVFKVTVDQLGTFTVPALVDSPMVAIPGGPIGVDREWVEVTTILADYGCTVAVDWHRLTIHIRSTDRLPAVQEAYQTYLDSWQMGKILPISAPPSGGIIAWQYTDKLSVLYGTPGPLGSYIILGGNSWAVTRNTDHSHITFSRDRWNGWYQQGAVRLRASSTGYGVDGTMDGAHLSVYRPQTGPTRFTASGHGLSLSLAGSNRRLGVTYSSHVHHLSIRAALTHSRRGTEPSGALRLILRPVSPEIEYRSGVWTPRIRLTLSRNIRLDATSSILRANLKVSEGIWLRLNARQLRGIWRMNGDIQLTTPAARIQANRRGPGTTVRLNGSVLLSSAGVLARPLPQYGRAGVCGAVVDSAGTGIPDVFVVCEGLVTLTTQQGKFTLWDLSPGEHVVEVEGCPPMRVRLYANSFAEITITRR